MFGVETHILDFVGCNLILCLVVGGIVFLDWQTRYLKSKLKNVPKTISYFISLTSLKKLSSKEIIDTTVLVGFEKKCISLLYSVIPYLSLIPIPKFCVKDRNKLLMHVHICGQEVLKEKDSCPRMWMVLHGEYTALWRGVYGAVKRSL